MIVQRYDLVGEYNFEMVEYETGDYVLYSDYQKLEQKLAELEMQNKMLAANSMLKIRKLQDKIAEILASIVAEKGEENE